MTLLTPCIDECGRLTPSTRCVECRRAKYRAREATRPSPTQRGYGHAWRQIRAAHLATEPACRDCGTTGTPGNPIGVDHIKPKIEGGTDDPSNLATRCKRCHGAKTMADRNRRRRDGA